MSQAHPPGISIVIPAYEEAENLPALHKEIVEVCTQNEYDFEIIIIDDGSKDDTAGVVRALSPATYIRFRRNFGQTAAIDCGIRHATKEYIVTMDGDGQNDPHDIPLLLRTIEERNLDVVSGWRKHRKDPIRKRIASKMAAALRRRLINDGIHDSGCTLKIYRRSCFDGIRLYGEMHRFVPAVLRIRGYRVGEEVVNHRPRTRGRTKYNWRRGVKGIIDMISVWFWNKFAVRPLHLLGGLGIMCILLGIGVSLLGIVWYVMKIALFRNVLPVLAVFLFLAGTQLFVFGLMADMMAKHYFRTSGDESYSVAEVVRL